jgi:ABC-2 type transport system ATP-binding protein
MSLAISVKNLTRVLGNKTVLTDVTFDVPRGSICAFLGNNGAGKTTTISILTGLLAPTSGETLVLGKAMANSASELRHSIGTVFDAQNLFEDLTLAEHLNFSARMYGVPGPEGARRAEELIDLFSLRDGMHKPMHTFSHGMKKKAALSCALIHDPEILFLDEPFEGVDAGSIRTISDTLRDFASRGRTIFITSHILSLVEKLCNQIVILHRGQIVHQEDNFNIDTSIESLESLFLRATATGVAGKALSWNR